LRPSLISCAPGKSKARRNLGHWKTINLAHDQDFFQAFGQTFQRIPGFQGRGVISQRLGQSGPLCI
jgi:hypothetical protein